MMMGLNLKEVGARLPPGFRFNPTDEELVCHYLAKKIVNTESFALCTNEKALKNQEKSMSLVEINLHTVEPWQLPEVAKLNATEWYFFSFQDRKYATGFRTNRATGSGYWKATGKDRTVLDPSTRSVVGMRKTLVLYKNRAPNGIKTGWIMHEFRLETPHLTSKEDWVLCRVFHKAKVSTEHHHPISTSNLSCYQQNSFTMMLPFNNQNQIISIFSTQNRNTDNSTLQNVVYNNFGAREDTNNPATATSSVTEFAASVDGARCEQGQNDFLWNNMNLEEINSFLEPNNIQGTLKVHMDANSLAFF